MQGKTREEQFQIWKKRLNMAKSLHKDMVVNWADTILDEYAGKIDQNKDTGERYSNVAQIIHAVEETIQPHLMFQSPRVYVTAKSPQFEKREPLVSAVINNEYSDLKNTGYGIELENELAMLDGRLLGFGATKSSWEVEGGIIEEKQDQSMIEKLKGFVTGSQPETVKQPVIEKEIGHVTEQVCSLDIYLDPTARHITKQKFFFQKMDVSMSQIRNSRYEQDKILNMKPSVSLVPESSKWDNKNDRDKLMNDPDFRGFRIYECHDLENRVIHTIADGVDDFIEFDSPYPIDEGSQFSFVWFLDNPNGVYPLPPVKFYRKRAADFSYIYSQVSEQIDKFLPKLGIDKNRLDKPDQERLKLGNLSSIVGFNGSPSGAWDVIQPQVNPDLFKFMAMTKEMLNLEAGTSDVELQDPNEDRTATQDVKLDRGIKSRRLKPQKRVKGFVICQAHIIWQLIAKNQTEERFIKILGPNDAEDWWTDPLTGKQAWTKENITGDYLFAIDIETLNPLNKQERDERNEKAMATALNPALAQGLMREGYEFLLSGVTQKYFKENLGIKDSGTVLRKMNFLEPSEEHDLWMNGQYPPIGERELKDQEFLLKHFAGHSAFIDSPGFMALPPELQAGALEHRDSYIPHLAKIQKEQSAGNQGAPGKPMPKEKEKPQENDPFGVSKENPIEAFQ